MLEDLKKEELEKFKWFLRDRDVLVELQPIPESKLEKASTCELVDLVVQTYTEKAVEVTKKVLKKINRNDLVQKLLDSSSWCKGNNQNGVIDFMNILLNPKYFCIVRFVASEFIFSALHDCSMESSRESDYLSNWLWHEGEFIM